MTEKERKPVGLYKLGKDLGSGITRTGKRMGRFTDNPPKNLEKMGRSTGEEMRKFINKGKGWHGQPARHALASRGIKTTFGANAIDKSLTPIKDEMIEKSKQQALTYDEKKELVERTSDEWRLEPYEVIDYFQEVGAPIILTEDGNLKLGQFEYGHGTSTYVPKGEGNVVGKFHVHPSGRILPSIADLRLMAKADEDINVIGTIVGDEVVVVSFEKPDESIISDLRGAEMMELRETSDLFTSSSPTDDDDVIGYINAYEDTTPTPLEILEEYPFMIDNALEHSDNFDQGWSREEIVEELKEGVIPSPIHESMGTVEHREIDLPVYDKETEKEMMKEDINKLKRYFDNVTVIKRSVE